MTSFQQFSQPIDEPTSTARSIWIFVAMLKQVRGELFLYGCAAPCSSAAEWSDDRNLILAGSEIVIAQRTIEASHFHAFHEALHIGKIRPALLLGRNVPDVAVAVERMVIQYALGQNAAKAHLYSSLPELNALIGDDQGVLAAILKALEAELGLPFQSSYASRIGNFEVFDLHPWLDQPQPFVCENVRKPGLKEQGPENWEIARTPAFAQAQHIAHFVGEVADDLVVDRLITLAPLEARATVVAPEPLDRFTFRLFDATGRTLLHIEQHTMLRQVHFSLSPIHRQVRIEDDLSRRAAQGGQSLEVSATTVQGHTSQRSAVGAPAKGSWRRFTDDMKAWIALHAPLASQDRWFPRGIDGEVGAIAHLNQLMSGARVSGAVLVDPWFGVDALSRLVLRLASRDVHLAIVTSWTRVDPDTNQPLDQNERAIRRLEAALDRVRPFINPKLKVINVVDGQDQAFHDRYLLLHSHEGPAKIFLLSNSLNKAAGKWPFVMSLLADDVGRQVERYIEGLIQGEDVARGKTLTINFEWPSSAR